MKRLIIVLATAFALHAGDYGWQKVTLPITQENHHYWMRSYLDQRPGDKAMAVLNHDVLAPAGQKGRWKDNIDVPLGTRIYGTVAKDGSESTWTAISLPAAEFPENRVDLDPFTIKGLLKEGE
jgi:hypothetical protein